MAGIDLEIRAGEYVALVGSNGSGKSTLARHLNALLMPSQGSVHVAGDDTRNPATWPAIRHRVQMVFQRPDTQIVATIVEEDVAFGPENFGLPQAALTAQVREALETVGMWELRSRPPHFLSGGQKQRVAIAGALAVRPQVLILDEATAMLDPAGRTAVLDLLRMLHAQGITIITITHDMDEAAQASRVVVLSQGRVALDGTPPTVFRQDGKIRELGLDLPAVAALALRLGLAPCLTPAELLAELKSAGRFNEKQAGEGQTPAEPKDWPPARRAPVVDGASEPIVQVRDLSHVYLRGTPFEVQALTAINVTVSQDEITGLAGQTGSGKSTLIQHLNGLLRPQTGEVIVDGDHWADPHLDVRAARRKVGLLFQQPEDQLFERYLGDDVAFGPRQWQLDKAEVRTRVQEAMDAVGLPFAEFKDRLTNTLSGGERRRAALAGVLALRPSVLVVDEPTAGLDPRGRAEVLAILRSAHAAGTTVIMATHRMEDIAALCDRLIALAHGQVAAAGPVRAVFLQSARDDAAGLPHAPLAGLIAALQTAGLPVRSDAMTVDEIAADLLGA